MNTKKHVLSGLALVLVFVPAAVAQNPKGPRRHAGHAAHDAITLDAKPTTIVYANVTTLSGRLSGAHRPQRRAAPLAATPRPPTATATSRPPRR